MISTADLRRVSKAKRQNVYCCAMAVVSFLPSNIILGANL
jgi:hypothetical protein